MAKKKRVKTAAKPAVRKKTSSRNPKQKPVKKKSAGRKKAKPAARPKTRKKRDSGAKLRAAVSPRPTESRAAQEYDIREEIAKESQDIFTQTGKMTWRTWMVRYSPVIITMIVGLSTYFFLVFYLFYPQTLLYGHYIQLLLLLMFIFFVIGVMIYLGIQAELMFIRIMSFAFVFIIFTFLLIFILLANSMYG